MKNTTILSWHSSRHDGGESPFLCFLYLTLFKVQSASTEKGHSPRHGGPQISPPKKKNLLTPFGGAIKWGLRRWREISLARAVMHLFSIGHVPSLVGNKGLLIITEEI